MKTILKSQVFLGLLGFLSLFRYGAPSAAFSFISGSGLMLISFLLLYIGWRLIFKKKLVALAIMVIVFKYAILGIIIFTIVKLPWFHAEWFLIGVASFVLSALFFAFKESLKKEGNENVI